MRQNAFVAAFLVSISGQRFSRQASRNRRSTSPRRTTAPFSRRPRLEPLEDRRLLSITVNTLADTVNFNDGVTSLREAIFAANTVPGADTIDFAPSLTSGGPAAILLTQGELAITDSLTINGPGATLLTIDASGNDPTPNLNNGDGSRVLNINDGTSGNLLDVSISGLTLTGGDASGTGGAISTRENLSIAHSIITGNSTSSPQVQGGGGIYSGAGFTSPLSSSLTVIDCAITDNWALRSEGGGIRKRSGRLVVEGCTFSGNTALLGGGVSAADERIEVQISGSTFIGNIATGGTFGGGGVFLSNGSLTLANSTMSGNSAPRGGGLYLDSNGQAALNGCIIGGNFARISGGGVFGRNLTVTDSTISGNSAGIFGGGNGGGIWASGNVTVTSSTISGNSAADSSQGGLGGGILVGGNVTVTSSTISGNSARYGGGGILAVGNVTVTSSTISGNWTGGRFSQGGGGIAANGDVMVTASTISGNSAGYGGGGGILATYGNVTVTSSTISGNSASGSFIDGGGFGGGILAKHGDVTVTDSTISGNSASGFPGGGHGGGIWVAFGNVTVTNSTISGNGASGFGGGIWAGVGNVTVTSSTISGNSAGIDGSGGGIYASSGPVTITNSIVAGNWRTSGTDPPVADDLAGGSIFTLGYSIVGAAVGAINTIPGTINFFGVDPRLGPLAYNGGPTMPDGSKMLTYALLPGSPAINAGDPAAVAGMNGVPLYDQRGAPWSRVVGGRLDIGAVESQPNPLPGDYNFDGLVDTADYTVWCDTLGSTTDLRADGDASGSVDASDYGFWKSRFGNVFSASGAGNGASAALTEPAALAPGQHNIGIRATTLDIAPGSPAASPGIARPSPVEKISAVVARQDLLLEAWSVTRSGEHRQQVDWTVRLRSHETAAEEPPSDVASAIDSAFALLGVISE